MIDKAIFSLSNRIAQDQNLTIEQEATRLGQLKNKNRQGILSDLNEIGKSGSLEDIIFAEKAIVTFGLEEYANSASMKSSLVAAQKELEAIEANIALVAQPEVYRQIDVSLSLPKLRDSHDLPLDGARTAFRSHRTRLGNYDRSRSDDLEKSIIQARQQNIRIAEKIYIERQEHALGREAELEQDDEPGAGLNPDL
ncbi:hypothetical protein AGMMS49960_05260 [Betaproteobacteria bacterium]|nr:hypothetical protein AGMMS49543_05190 [Betaproteobacteria bacterium]GHT99591.1 hypothetical protein AGMMS49960_05260 [Betaproteobacteria bacterium]GHU06514.1 hypothetical protein AGMMS50225_01630 [Betaproteobacteria bacterium]GHU20966.1 hypothetical protein AGMMS50243_17470 [Betaproteobacteria bacterium]